MSELIPRSRSLMHDTLQDVRYGIRMLRRNWIVMGVALLSLAVAIGANTAIFTLLNALVFQLLPIREPRELTQVVSTHNGRRSDVFSVPAVQAMQESVPGFSGLFGVSSGEGYPVGPAASVERALVVWASGSYFTTLGLRPTAGRLLVAADDTPGAPPVAVASYSYWQRQLGGRIDALGQPVLVQGVAVTVVGVAPRGFNGMTVGQQADLTLPIAALPTVLPASAGRIAPGNQWLRVFARVPAGTPVDQAAARLTTLWPSVSERAISPKMSPQRQDEIRRATLTLIAGGAGWSPLRAQYADPLYVLMGGVALVLLIAYGNVVHLLLSRGAARGAEMSVRLAIGAGRARLVRQMITEGVILTTAAAALGLLIAYGLSRLILNILSVGRLDVVGLDVSPNGRILVFSLIVAIVTGLGLGAATAYALSGRNPASLMTGRGASANRRSRAAGWLVAAQMAFSLILLVGAAVFVQTLRNFEHVDTGFTSDDVLLVRVDPTLVVKDKGEIAQVYETMLDRIRRLAGVKAAALSKTTPLSGLKWTDGVRVAGGREMSNDDRVTLVNAVSPDYFKALSIRLVAGRDFTATDTLGAQKVAIVSEAFVRHHLGTEPAIGRVLSFDPGPPDLKDLTITGVVSDTVWTNLKAAAPPSVYVPILQQRFVLGSGTIEVQAADGRFAQVASDVRAVVRQALPTINVTMVGMTDEIRQTFLRERLLATFAAGFALVALGLSAVGVYALVTDRVSRRTREIAIRLAIGAERSKVIGMVVRDVTLLIGAGLGIGLIGSWLASRYVSSLVFGLAPTDLSSSVAMTLVLFALGLIAAYLPARRAAAIDPNQILRAE